MFKPTGQDASFSREIKPGAKVGRKGQVILRVARGLIKEYEFPLYAKEKGRGAVADMNDISDWHHKISFGKDRRRVIKKA